VGVPPSTRNIFHWFCTNLVSGPGGEWGGLTPQTPVASPLPSSVTRSCSTSFYRFFIIELNISVVERILFVCELRIIA